MTITHSWIDDIAADQLEDDPQAIHAKLRDQAPLAWVPEVGMYVASSYDINREMTSDPDTWYGVISPSGHRTHGEGTVLSANGEEHTKLRAMMDPYLRPSAVDSYIDDMVRPHAQRLLAQIEDTGEADLQAAYFVPISVRAVGDVMGLHQVSESKLTEWFKALALGARNVAVNADGSWANPEGFAAADQAKREMRGIVDPLLDEWTDRPGHTLISHWLHDGLSEGETRDRELVYSNMNVYILGALQEPGHLMATTLVGLLRSPDQFDRVVDDPSLIPRAVSESLRWVAPIFAAAAKVATRDVHIGGLDLPAGTAVLMAYGAANWDEKTWPGPQEFDLDRPLQPHLGFGAGPHACAGAYLGSAIVRIALEELFQSIPMMELTEDVKFHGWAFRGPEHVRVRWEV
ncbi:cytochrome P450 [Pseudonocardia nantongensis]|uniref:cytochrome P450 n=1 Tax=Pseudonocardia nantongensis TaxID=1181885 RepID=UPI003979B8A0